MAAEEHILGNIVRVGLLYKEGVLHIAGRVVGSKVEHRKYVLVVIYLRTLEKGKAHASENVDNLDRKSTRLNSSHGYGSRMPSSA